jgi:uncharacterized membrane protein
MTLFFVFLIGVLAGLRSLTPVAATAWGAHLGWFRLPRLLAWIGTTPAAIIFTVLAFVELTTDKLPKTPSRTVPMQLIARILMGAFAGACLATGAGQGAVLGVLLAGVGSLVGTFAGYQVRARSVKALSVPDFVIAVIEDLVAIGGSLWVVSRF